MKRKININMKIAIPVMAAILVLLIVLKVLGVGSENSGMKYGFVGTGTFHTYEGSYVKIKGNFAHKLSPSDDATAVRCEITTDSGELHVQIIQTSDDKVIFDKTISGNETFEVPADGKVKIKLSTEGHEGSYKFKY
ncbi:MAG: hypothetical protein K6G45_04020 [Lachnospiraceae bacterium]|nr:hypothetical protein [Lachnospiraceae bacterium]MCR5767642.1 hypothetical protein [Lachnospiraceae bacterium]